MTSKLTTRLLKKLRRSAMKAQSTPNWGDDGDDNFNEEWIPDVALALLDALEARDKRIAEQEGEKQHLEYRLQNVQDAHMQRAKLAFDNEQLAAKAMARAESAEQALLERQKEVVVKQFSEFQICHYGTSEDYAKGFIDCQNHYNKALSAAGISLQKGDE